MQNFLFRKIELWLVLLILLLTGLASILFGAAALDGERKTGRFGAAGEAAKTVADIPETLNRMLKQKRAMAITKPDRFKDRPGGWSFAEGAGPLPGYVLLSRYDSAAKRQVVELVSLGDGKVHHTWRPNAEALLAGAPRTSKVADFTGWDNFHYRTIHPLLLDDGSLIVKDHQSYLMRIDACAKKIWRLDTLLAHHATEPDGKGGFWVPGLIEPQTIPDVQEDFREDALLNVDADGKIISMESLPQILLDHGMDWTLFNASHRNRDPVHLNDIQPVLEDGPYWKAGDLFLSMRHTSMIMLYRPSTREIVWTKQGPWLAQHDVDILDDHRISIFDNRAYDRGTGARVDGANQVTIYDFATKTLSGPWDKTLADLEVHTLSEGLVDQLPGGGIMVEEENSGRLVIMDADAKLIAEYINQGEDGIGYRLGWSRYVDQALGDRVLAAVTGTSCDGP